MAEILVKAVDATSADPEKNLRGCYKRGDVVVVKPDGHQWGRLEGPPKFTLIKIPGVAVSRVQHLVKPDVVDGVTMRRRLSTVDLAGIQDRSYTEAEITTRSTDKRTGTRPVRNGNGG